VTATLMDKMAEELGMIPSSSASKTPKNLVSGLHKTACLKLRP